MTAFPHLSTPQTFFAGFLVLGAPDFERLRRPKSQSES
jgi:hypothetical protein